MRFHRFIPLHALTVITLLSGSMASIAIARPARPAPSLPAPTGSVVNVSTEAQLQAAVAKLASNTTIVLAPGTYKLTSTLYINGTFTNVGIRGGTDNRDDVVLVGPGMANASYGNAPYGIWTGGDVNGVTIANLTIRDFYYHPIIFNGGTQSPHVYNVHLIDAGQQFIKSNPDEAGNGASNGIVEYSVIDTRPRRDYTKVDFKARRTGSSAQPVQEHRGPPGQWPAPLLVWSGSSNTIAEGNTFLNCARGVLFGADDLVSPSHRGGMIRNNIF